jgi:hypothetical protein
MHAILYKWISVSFQTYALTHAHFVRRLVNNEAGLISNTQHAMQQRMIGHDASMHYELDNQWQKCTTESQNQQ